MAEATTVGWFPVLTAFIGLLTGAILEWLRDRRIIRREREAREATRREQHFERRTNFQRQTLLDLQEAVMRVLRTTGEMHSQKVLANRAGSKWGKHLFEEDLDSRAREANTQTTMLMVRVRDEIARNLVDEVKNASTDALFAPNILKAEEGMQKMVTEFDKLNKRIGQLLRELDDDENAGCGNRA